MAKIEFPKKQEQRLIPKHLLEYADKLQKNHPDPSAEWGGSGAEYTAGTGIKITNDNISIDSTVVATKNDIPDVSGFISDDDLSKVLEDYELKSEAFSGSYNDLIDKPTIPTKTSDLNNDSGFITGINSSDVITALGYTPGTSNFSGNYNDLTNKPTIPTVNNNTITITQGGVTKGSFRLNQNTDQTIELDAGGAGGVQLQNNSMVGLVTESTDSTNKPSISISDFTSPEMTTYKLNLPEKNGIVATLDDIPAVPDAVSGTNDGTNWTSLTIGNDTYGLASSGSTPTNMVTTDTTQTITGDKTFNSNVTFGTASGSKKFKFYGVNPIQMYSPSSRSTGFTLFNSSNVEKGYLQYVQNRDGLYLGRWGANGASELGFLSQTNDSKGYKVLVPNLDVTGSDSQNVNYLTLSVNNIKADSSGNISLDIPDVSNYYTKTEIDDMIGNIETLLAAI